MSFFKYIGEFFLFRWLFGSRRHDGDSDSSSPSAPLSGDTADHSDAGGQTYDDFLDEQADYDMMDDMMGNTMDDTMDDDF